MEEVMGWIEVQWVGPTLLNNAPRLFALDQRDCLSCGRLLMLDRPPLFRSHLGFLLLLLRWLMGHRASPDGIEEPRSANPNIRASRFPRRTERKSPVDPCCRTGSRKAGRWRRRYWRRPTARKTRWLSAARPSRCSIMPNASRLRAWRNSSMSLRRS